MECTINVAPHDWLAKEVPGITVHILIKTAHSITQGSVDSNFCVLVCADGVRNDMCPLSEVFYIYDNLCLLNLNQAWVCRETK